MLEKLHVLFFCIIFAVLMIYHCLHDTAPKYLSELYTCTPALSQFRIKGD